MRLALGVKLARRASETANNLSTFELVRHFWLFARYLCVDFDCLLRDALLACSLLLTVLSAAVERSIFSSRQEALSSHSSLQPRASTV